MKTEEFVKTINKLRLDNKNKWYFWRGEVEGKRVNIKGFDTWLQVFNIDGVTIPSPMEMKVKQFKETLQKVKG